MGLNIQAEPNVDVADFYLAGDHSFWLIHRCIEKKTVHKGAPQYVCVDCGAELAIKKSHFLDSIRVVKTVGSDLAPARAIRCTSEEKVIIPCVVKYPTYLKDAMDVAHLRCEVSRRHHGDYTEVTCLDCGETSTLAINSFSVLPADYNPKKVRPCVKGNGAKTEKAEEPICAAVPNEEQTPADSESEVMWYDDVKLVPAETLSGWNWQQYGDGSGSLISPSEKSYFGYDLSTKEYRMPGVSGNEWRFFDGYPYDCISFDEFKKWAESWIRQNIITAR